MRVVKLYVEVEDDDYRRLFVGLLVGYTGYIWYDKHEVERYIYISTEARKFYLKATMNRDVNVSVVGMLSLHRRVDHVPMHLRYDIDAEIWEEPRFVLVYDYEAFPV